MENHWQKLWNNRKINFEELNARDEARLILELKRIVGWDFKNSTIAADEFRKEYEYIRSNLGLSDNMIRGGYIRGRLRQRCQSLLFPERRLQGWRLGLRGEFA